MWSPEPLCCSGDRVEQTRRRERIPCEGNNCPSCPEEAVNRTGTYTEVYGGFAVHSFESPLPLTSLLPWVYISLCFLYSLFPYTVSLLPFPHSFCLFLFPSSFILPPQLSSRVGLTGGSGQASHDLAQRPPIAPARASVSCPPTPPTWTFSSCASPIQLMLSMVAVKVSVQVCSVI